MHILWHFEIHNKTQLICINNIKKHLVVKIKQQKIWKKDNYYVKSKGVYMRKKKERKIKKTQVNRKPWLKPQNRTERKYILSL